MGLFNFKNLIRKFGKYPPVKIITQEGYYDYDNGGVFVKGSSTEEEFEGAVVPLSTSDLKFEENGRYKKEDKKLYCYEHFEVADKIRHKGFVYMIDQKKDYSDFDDNLSIYYMVRSDVLGTDAS